MSQPQHKQRVSHGSPAARRETAGATPSLAGPASIAPFVRPDWLCVAAIFALALTLRLIAIYQARTLVFSQSLVSDGEAYDKWAQRIVAGDWLGKEVFYQAPLYPYFLAMVQLAVGHDYARIRIVQCVIGAISCVLLFLVGRRLISRQVGLIAGLMLALYAPAVFFDGLIQKAVLDLLFLTLLLWLLARQTDAPSHSGTALSGMVLGLFALTRENALVLAPVIVLWTLFARAHPAVASATAQSKIQNPKSKLSKLPIRARLARPAAFLVGMALILLPVGLRNLAVGGEFALTTSQAGPNFYIGNHAGAPGTYVPLIPDRMDPAIERRDATDLAEKALGRKLSPGEVSSYWFGQSWAYIAANPGDWLMLLGRKFMLTVNAYEIPDAEDWYYYQTHVPLLGMLGKCAHIGVLAPLAAVGIVLSWSSRRRLALVYAMLLTLIAAVALFYVFARYRYPIVPPLVLLAAVGLFEVWRLFRRWPDTDGDADEMLAACDPKAGRASPETADTRSNAAVCTAEMRAHDTRHVAGIARRNERRISLAATRLGLATVCGGVTAGIVNQTILPPDAGFYVSHVNAGYAYAKIGRLHEAIAEYRTALAVKSGSWGLHHHLGQLLVQTGQPDAAIPVLYAAAKLNPDIDRVWMWLGFAYADEGDKIAAVEHLQRALAINPNEAETLNRLGSLKTTLGEWPDGIADMRRSLALVPDHPGFKLNLAWALATAPDSAFETGMSTKVTTSAETRTPNSTAWQPATTLPSLEGRGGGRVDFPAETPTTSPAAPPTTRDATTLPSLQGRGRGRVETPPSSLPAHPAALPSTAAVPLRNPAEAVELAERAAMAMTLANGPVRDPRVFDVVAAAYASAGRFDHAIKTLEKGLELIPPTDASPFAQELRSRLALYKSGKPFHHSP